MEKLDLLMATYNGEKYLKEQIESILNQTYTDFNLLICDDCSSDNTLQILEEYASKDSRIKIFKNETNQGVIKNFENLLNKVTCKYYMFADQDDVWKNDKIEKSVKRIEETKSDLVFCDLEVVDSKLNLLNPSYWKQKGFYKRIVKYNGFEAMYLNNYVTGCTIIARSEKIKDIMPLPKETKYLIHDYWIALMSSNLGTISFIDEPLIKYRQHENNEIGSKRKSDSIKDFDELRNLFLDVKIEHFRVFKENNHKFNSKYQELNNKALEYFERLTTVKYANFSNWGLFFKLYKYENFKYKILNFLILNFPGISRFAFKLIKGRK